MRFRSIELTPWQRDFSLVVLPAMALVAYSLSPRLLTDSDTYWHLATGRWILEHGAVPTVDPFSFTFRGRPWVAHEWLSEVLFASAAAVGGLAAVMLLAASAAAGCLAIIGAWVGRRVGPIGTILVLVAVFLMLSPMLLARPHVLALPVMAAWTAELLSARARNRAPSLWLLPLMVLWANLHGSYVFGLALVAPFALEALIAAERAGRLRTVLTWGGFGLAATAAAAITPHGVEGLIFPFQLMSLETIGMIREWKSADFSRVRPFEVVLLGALFMLLWRGVRVPWVRLALLLILLHMALAHVRHGAVLAVVGALVLADPIGRAYPPRPGDVASPSRRDVWLLSLVAAAIFAVIAAVRLSAPVSPPDSPNTPATALAHVPAQLRARPAFNEYGFGGLLIYEGAEPFIDGRADMYGDAHLRRYRRIVGGDPSAFMAAVRQYDIAWTIIEPKSALALWLASAPEWRRIYADRYAVVYERRPAPQPM
jgi:hypothetical protein